MNNGLIPSNFEIKHTIDITPQAMIFLAVALVFLVLTRKKG